MSWMVDGVGRFLAHYLEKPVQGYEPFTPTDPDALRATLRPGDVLLVEGNNHISGVIKYLTQSTWSHAALYVGPIGDRATAEGEPLVLVEANIGARRGRSAAVEIRPLPHAHLPADPARRGGPRARLRLRSRAHRLRLRPQEHHRSDALSVSAAGAATLAPPHDGARLRPSDPHHLLGADRAGFETVRYPILPKVTRLESEAARAGNSGNSPFLAVRAARFRHSPYFEVVKPTIVRRLRLQGDGLGGSSGGRCRRNGRAWCRPTTTLAPVA